MILQSHIQAGNIFSDPRIVKFSRGTRSASELQAELNVERRNFQRSTLLSIFDFNGLLQQCSETTTHINTHKEAFNDEAGTWLLETVKLIGKCQETANKFKPQLLGLLSEDEAFEANIKLHSRIAAASRHFDECLREVIDRLRSCPVVTDSTLFAKEFNEGIKELFAQTSMKRFILQGLFDGFILRDHQQRIRKFDLPPFYVNSYAGQSQVKITGAHPELQQQLRRLRDRICARGNLPVYLVAASKSIDEMATYLPHTLQELDKINGFGEAKIKKYGSSFLDIIIQYCSERDLCSVIHHKVNSHNKRTNSSGVRNTATKTETFKLFRQGKSLVEISEARKLKKETIEGHLAHYIREGEINIEELISREKLAVIEPVINDLKGSSLSILKAKLGDTVSFSEIKLAIAWQKSRERIESV